MSPIFARLRQVRRGLAGLLFFVAAILLALAAGGWWLQRVAFNPSTAERSPARSSPIRSCGRKWRPSSPPPPPTAVGKPENQLNLEVAANAGYPEAAEFLADIVADIHARVIGAGGPVQITGPADGQHRAQPERRRAPGGDPAGGGGGDPRHDADRACGGSSRSPPCSASRQSCSASSLTPNAPTRSSASACCASSPVCWRWSSATSSRRSFCRCSPTTSGSRSSRRPPTNELRTVAALSCALAIVGVVLILGSAGFRRRKTGWSSPVRVARYNEQRRWS